jgi:UDP:flavonoid glycosyltransferase YjiC (YdhE family)
LEDFLKKGNGFIYMSFGSFAEISTFPEHIQNAFFNTFKKLKNVQVVWKMNVERPKDLPDFVFTTNWVPQQAVLCN